MTFPSDESGDRPARHGERDDAERWASAWGRPLDAPGAAEWMRTRAELDVVLERKSADPEDATGETVTDGLASFVAAFRSGFDPLGAMAFRGDRASGAGGPAATLAPGTAFGGCDILRLAGRGGMGEVYEAIDRALGPESARRVALKLLPSEAGGGLVASLHRDVAALSRLEHPSVARLYRAGVDRLPDGGRRPYLVTEFVDGVPILAFVEARCGADPRARSRWAVDLGERLAEALAASHAERVVHRDIKSSNVLVRPDGSLAVVDFGIAALAEPASADRETLADRLTMQPDAAGSLAAISPERARGRFGGPREDVWAIGSLLFEVATGRRVADLEGLPLFEAIRRIGDMPPPPVRSVDRRIPRDLAVVIDRCLAFDLADRYGSAGEVRDELRRVRAGVPPEARPIGPIGRSWRFVRRHPLASGLAGATATALLAGALVAGWLARAATRAQAIAEDREQLVRSVADGVLVEVADSLREIPGATVARRRLLDIGLAYAEAVSGPRSLAGDRDAALGLARSLFVLGELHRMQQPNAALDEPGRRVFARAAEFARSAAAASGDFDAEAIGLAVNADSLALAGRPEISPEAVEAAWLDLIERAERVLAIDPRQADALVGLARSCVRVGNPARLAGDFGKAHDFFTRAVGASTRLVEAHPGLEAAWDTHAMSLNTLWWLLYTEFREGNEARILDLCDEMLHALEAEERIAPTTAARTARLSFRINRTSIAVEFGRIEPAEAEATVTALAGEIAAMSDAEPELGLLRIRRREAYLNMGETLAWLATAADARGEATEAARLAERASEAYATCAAVQRDRMERGEEVFDRERQLLDYAIERSDAMGRYARERRGTPD